MASIPDTLRLAVNHHQSGQLQDAEQLYRQVLQASPQHPDAMHFLGLVWHQHGKHETAINTIHRAVSLKPNNANVLCDLGTAYDAAGEFDQAISSYQQALRIEPNYAQAHNNLGNAFVARQRLDEAIACFQRALQLKPDYATAHYNLGRAFKVQGQCEEAIASYQRALQLKPNYVVAHYNLGVVFGEQGRLEEAIGCYQRVLQINPNHANSHNNLGNALRTQRRFEEAIASFRSAIGSNPDHAEAHSNLGMTLLSCGDFEQGFAEYEWRWKLDEACPRNLSQPLWDGTPLSDRTILLQCEQGLGDTLQFIRYAALVKQQGARVVVECQEPLVPMLQNCAAIDQLVTREEELPAFDVHAPLLSLPGIMGTRIDSIPANVPYVFADPEIGEQWRESLREMEGFKVGVCWQGNPSVRRDRCRSIPLFHFEPLASIPGVQLFSLQQGAGSEQLTKAQFPIKTINDSTRGQLRPFMHTAGAMMNLDLVITSDTSLAHLAGALGVPTWVALSYVADWRWFLDREDSPWYPTMRLFRQREPGAWDEVFTRIAKEVSHKLASA